MKRSHAAAMAAFSSGVRVLTRTHLLSCFGTRTPLRRSTLISALSP
jgi:hypothetical protein